MSPFFANIFPRSIRGSKKRLIFAHAIYNVEFAWIRPEFASPTPSVNHNGHPRIRVASPYSLRYYGDCRLGAGSGRLADSGVNDSARN